MKIAKLQFMRNFEKILKIFDKKSIEKLNFNYFWKVVAKNRAFGNNIVLLQQFFPFRGGGLPPCPPRAYDLKFVTR